MHDDTSSRAIKDINGRSTHPRLEFIDRQRDVLGIGLIKDPNFTVIGRFGNAMAIVMKQDPLPLGHAAQRQAQLLDIINGGVGQDLVAGAGLPALVLGLQLLADHVEALLGGVGAGIDPALHARAGRGLLHVRWVDADVEAAHQPHRDGLHAVAHAPLHDFHFFAGFGWLAVSFESWLFEVLFALVSAFLGLCGDHASFW